MLTEPNTIIGHDVTLPFKLKLLNYKFRSDPIYRRSLEKFFEFEFKNIDRNIAFFNKSLNLNQISVLGDFNRRVNFSSVVNKRRFSLHRNIWLPFKYNFYYSFNWLNYLHKSSNFDEVGFRNYKINPYFDLYHGYPNLSLKIYSLQHLILSQIPRFELDSRRRIPTFISPREFNLLILNYFKYVNNNFLTKDYHELRKKVLRYANRHVFSQYPIKLKKKVLFVRNFFNLFASTKYIYFNKDFDIKFDKLFFPIKMENGKSSIHNNFFDLFQINFDLFLKNFFSRLARFELFRFQFSYSDSLRSMFVLLFKPSSHNTLKVQKEYKHMTIMKSFVNTDVPRIFGLNTMLKLRLLKERSLDPVGWLRFDLFSRVRPSFRPFMFKFSKKFMFSKFVRSKGIPSFSDQIKSHTSYDNFFERHPYISFSVGSLKNNDLVLSESSYKEIRKRSSMLDFVRVHHGIANPRDLDFRSKHRRHNRRSLRFNNLNLFVKKRFKKKGSSVFRNHIILLGRPGKRRFRSWLKQPFGSNFGFDFNGFGHRSVKRLFKNMKRHFSIKRAKTHFIKSHGNIIPFFDARFKRLKFKYNGLNRGAVYFASMINPKQYGGLKNKLLVRPYNSFLAFVRSDNYNVFFDYSKFFDKLGSLSFSAESKSRYRSYNQPNLKLFFDFNAYKQRYNLGLLFRDLSFERDFRFFVFKQKTSRFRFDNNSFSNDIFLLSGFTKFRLSDYFDLFVSEKSSFKIPFVRSNVYYFFEELFFKINPFYIFLVVFDFYVVLVFSFFKILVFFHELDFFPFFRLILQTSPFYYVPKRAFFHLFFHLGLFQDYFKFIWFFQLKFVIFNVGYYPFYFIVFFFFLILRIFSFNIKSVKYNVPYVVPNYWRFSDLNLNSHSGWFDSAWNEVKTEAFERLRMSQLSNNLELSKDVLLSSLDLQKIRRKYNLDSTLNMAGTDGNLISESRFINASSDNQLVSVPLGTVRLKGLFSRLRTLVLVDSSNKVVDPSLSGDLDNSVNERSGMSFDFTKIGSSEYDDALDYKRKLSFFYIKSLVGLLLSRNISFREFIRKFNSSFSNKREINPFYNLDNFNDDFNSIFLTSSSQFNSIVDNAVFKNKRMFVGDENIHFYRKPGSLVYNSFLRQNVGTESTQLHYVVEFPGKFNNNYVNAFSKFYAIKNMSYNYPHIGFFSFSKNAKLPNSFDEFLIFCSKSSVSFNEAGLKDHGEIQSVTDLRRLQQLWALFQYVIRYDYNLLQDYNFRQVTHRGRFFSADLMNLFYNFKFWSNKASTDAIDLNYLRNFSPFFGKFRLWLFGVTGKKKEELGLSSYDFEQVSNQLTFVSFFYLLYVYFILFGFFIFLSFFFCFFFLFFIFLYNHFYLFLF